MLANAYKKQVNLIKNNLEPWTKRKKKSISIHPYCISKAQTLHGKLHFAFVLGSLLIFLFLIVQEAYKENNKINKNKEKMNKNK